MKKRILVGFSLFFLLVFTACQTVGTQLISTPEQRQPREQKQLQEFQFASWLKIKLPKERFWVAKYSMGFVAYVRDKEKKTNISSLIGNLQEIEEQKKEFLAQYSEGHFYSSYKKESSVSSAFGVFRMEKNFLNINVRNDRCVVFLWFERPQQKGQYCVLVIRSQGVYHDHVAEINWIMENLNIS